MKKLNFNDLPPSIRTLLANVTLLNAKDLPPFLLGRARPASTRGERVFALVALSALWLVGVLFGAIFFHATSDASSESYRFQAGAATCLIGVFTLLCAWGILGMLVRLGRRLPYREWDSLLFPSYKVSLQGTEVTLVPTSALGPVTVTSHMRGGRLSHKSASVAKILFSVPGCTTAEQSAEAFLAMRESVARTVAHGVAVGVHPIDPLHEFALGAVAALPAGAHDSAPRAVPSALERGSRGALMMAATFGVQALGALAFTAAEGRNAEALRATYNAPAVVRAREDAEVRERVNGAVARFVPRAASPAALRWVRAAIDMTRARQRETSLVSVIVEGPAPSEAAAVRAAMEALPRPRRMLGDIIDPTALVTGAHGHVAYAVAARLDRAVGAELGYWDSGRVLDFEEGAAAGTATVTIRRAALTVDRLELIGIRRAACPIIATRFEVTMRVGAEVLTREVAVPAASSNALVDILYNRTPLSSAECVVRQLDLAATAVAEQAASLLAR